MSSRTIPLSLPNRLPRAVAGFFAAGVLCVSSAATAPHAAGATAQPAPAPAQCPPAWLGTTNSWNGSVSGNGRFVVFHTARPGTDGFPDTDVVLRDLHRGVTVRLTGAAAPPVDIGSAVISDDGSRVAYLRAGSGPPSELGGRRHDLYVYDVHSGRTTFEGHADSSSTLDLSADGRHLVYQSAETDEYDWSIPSDIWVRDLDRDTVRLVSVSTSGGRGNGGSSQPRISADGRTVLFSSLATDLTTDDLPYGGLFVRDLTKNRTTILRDENGDPTGGAEHQLSPDGRYVVFTNVAGRLVRHDRATGEAVVFGPVPGEQRNLSSPRVSRNGRYAAYWTAYVTDPSESTGFMQIHVADLRTGTEEHASAGLDGDQSWRGSNLGELTPNGRYVVFYSEATNLVAGGDTNEAWDVFVRDLRTNRTTRVSVPDAGPPGCTG